MGERRNTGMGRSVWDDILIATHLMSMKGPGWMRRRYWIQSPEAKLLALASLGGIVAPIAFAVVVCVLAISGHSRLISERFIDSYRLPDQCPIKIGPKAFD